MLGCDYVDSIKGVGPHRAINLIKEHKSIEKIITALPEKLRENVPQDWKYDDARELFRNPEIADCSDIEVRVHSLVVFSIGYINFDRHLPIA